MQNLAEEANKPVLVPLYSCFLAINALVAGLKVEIPVKVPTIFMILTKTLKNPPSITIFRSPDSNPLFYPTGNPPGSITEELLCDN